jgi:16S rRNA (cytosine1402-N4)-methyltransferase
MTRGGEDRIAAGGPARHIPVLLAETLGALAPRPAASIVDGTFGAGGYSRALLERGARVVAIDRDPAAIAGGRRSSRIRRPADAGRGPLRRARRDRPRLRLRAVDGVALDIGVSSMQLDEAERGFSLRRDAPLDMRMEGRVAAPPTSCATTTSDDRRHPVLFRRGARRAPHRPRDRRRPQDVALSSRRCNSPR